MSELIKIRDVTAKYDISARALRYYEDMGLLSSAKSADYAYRLYDEEAVKRLEQILILRKLNIKVKDIQRIFQSGRSDTVFEVLGQKVADIDEEVALLHELREILLDFIRQIRELDFQREGDVKLLYEKVRDIEGRIANVDYNGNAADVNRMIELTERLEKKPDVTVYELPACKMLSSGPSTDPDPFGEEGLLARFDKLFSALDKRRKDRFFSRDFMWFDEKTGATTWWYALEDWMLEEDLDGFEIVDFEGGLYAAAISKDGDNADGQRVHEGIGEWVAASDRFQLDEYPGRLTMFHIAGTPASDQALGYSQMMVYRPIKAKESR